MTAKKAKKKIAPTDTDALFEALCACPAGAEADSHVIKTLKGFIARQDEDIRNAFFAGDFGRFSGAGCIHARSAMMDTALSALFRYAVDIKDPPEPESKDDTLRLALVATGGYGRGELAPYSDVDVVFLFQKAPPSPRCERIIEYILYKLWDLGLKVGHAVRSLDESVRRAKSDMVILTGLLETRHITGDENLTQELHSRIREKIMPGLREDFFTAKLEEREARHLRLGDSRYHLEPNIKEGKGGLRDLQSLFWLSNSLKDTRTPADMEKAGVLRHDEAERLSRAHNFLWAVRCHLHYLTNRAEERLTFDFQPDLAEIMGYQDRPALSRVERFMRHYFLVAREVGNLTNILCAAIEDELAGATRKPDRNTSNEIEGFPVWGRRLGIPGDDHFNEHPVDLIRIFRVSQKHDRFLHPQTYRMIHRSLNRIDPSLRRDKKANAEFMQILTAGENPEYTLRRMNEADVLGRFIPDFGQITAQMQYDMYHFYTVDEHTLQAIGMLWRLENGDLSDRMELAGRLVHEIDQRRALYVALLLHDIAKGRGGDHSQLGAGIARQLCPRLGLDDAETALVAWLVEHHLLMSNTAFKRDLSDPQTIMDFHAVVDNEECLKLLFILTCIDIHAVGPGRWTSWKAKLMGELYELTHGMIRGEELGASAAERIRFNRKQTQVMLSSWDPGALETFFALTPDDYWLAFDAESCARHARQVQGVDADEDTLLIDIRHDPDGSASEVTVYTPDRRALFSKLAGALAASGCNILDARIFTLRNDMALDVFRVQDTAGGALATLRKEERVQKSIEKTLDGKLDPTDAIARNQGGPTQRTRQFYVPPRIIIDNDASATQTVIDVKGRDRPGLLYDLTRVLAEQNIQVTSARIATFGLRATDVFYVKDIFGLKLTREDVITNLRRKLMDVLKSDPLNQN